jgi:undecaprenyl-diphosphatase
MPQALQSLDLWLFQALTPWHAGWLDTSMSWISISGTASTVWLLLAIFAMTRPRHRAAAWRLVLTLLLCFITVDLVLKPAVARPRPVSIRAYEPARAVPPLPRTLSFPSGHTAAAFGAAVSMSRMWPQGRVAWWAMALLMGYSRVYVGHHYPLDVAGGALVGILIALWVLGGRHPATYARLPAALPSGARMRP